MTDERAPVVVVDVQYIGDGARAAAVVLQDWASPDVLAVATAWLDEVPPYEPGRFYLRELPPLRAVLDRVGPVSVVVVDGYVDLDAAGRPGLGRYVHDAVGVPVVGVAKTPFRGADHAAEVRRGASERPLYVTSVGMTLATAAQHVAAMSGSFRLPDAVRLADRVARSGDETLRFPAGRTPVSPR